MFLERSKECCPDSFSELRWTSDMLPSFPLHHVTSLKCGLQSRVPKGKLLLLSHPATQSPMWCHLWLLPTWKFLVSPAEHVSIGDGLHSLPATQPNGTVQRHVALWECLSMIWSSPNQCVPWFTWWNGLMIWVWHTPPWALAEKSLQCISSPVWIPLAEHTSGTWESWTLTYFNIV